MDNSTELAQRMKAEASAIDDTQWYLAKPSDIRSLAEALEARDKRAVEMPTFDGYVPHIARELQAAFRIACDNAGINIAAGKGE